MEIQIIFSIAVLIMSVVIHELAHGYMADYLGDPTAKYAGRLTLNPIAHLDLMGSFIVPVLMVMFSGGVLFGWAKPVPVNPYNLRNQKWGEALVALAGPVSNLVLALIFGLCVRFSAELGLGPTFVELSVYIVLINVVLVFFNLIPIPPLDGSKILFAFLGSKANDVRYFFERYWLITIFLVVFVIFPAIAWPVMDRLFWLFTGMGLPF